MVPIRLWVWCYVLGRVRKEEKKVRLVGKEYWWWLLLVVPQDRPVTVTSEFRVSEKSKRVCLPQRRISVASTLTRLSVDFGHEESEWVRGVVHDGPMVALNKSRVLDKSVVRYLERSWPRKRSSVVILIELYVSVYLWSKLNNDLS